MAERKTGTRGSATGKTTTSRSAGGKRATGKTAKAPSNRALMTRADAAAGGSSSPEERHRMIAEQAYYLAERRGFDGDRCLDDWLQAESEIDRRLAG